MHASSMHWRRAAHVAGEKVLGNACLQGVREIDEHEGLGVGLVSTHQVDARRSHLPFEAAFTSYSQLATRIDTCDHMQQDAHRSCAGHWMVAR